MGTTLLDREQRRLLKRFHTLLGKAGVGSDGKAAILSGYGVESSRDLSAYELLEACNALDKLCDPAVAELDRWRKRVIASIGGWLRLMGYASATGNDIGRIKAIACRATGVGSFNDIPLERLRSVYSAFKNKQKDMRRVEVVTAEMMEWVASMN